MCAVYKAPVTVYALCVRCVRSKVLGVGVSSRSRIYEDRQCTASKNVPRNVGRKVRKFPTLRNVGRKVRKEKMALAAGRAQRAFFWGSVRVRTRSIFCAATTLHFPAGTGKKNPRGTRRLHV